MRGISHSQTAEPFIEYLLRFLRSIKVEKFIKHRSVVSDLGCGYDGYFLKRISKKIKEGVGYDIAVTTTNLPRNVILQKADLNQAFNKKKDYFDTVTALAVLEHVEHPEYFLSQIKTMLKKHGCLILTTPHKRAKSILEFIAFKTGLISKEEILDHKNYFDEDSLRKLLKNVNLRVVNFEIFSFGFNIFLVAEKN